LLQLSHNRFRNRNFQRDFGLFSPSNDRNPKAFHNSMNPHLKSARASNPRLKEDQNVKRVVYLATLAILANRALAQNAPVEQEPLTITSTSSLVVVPTLVRSSSGEPVANLHASDFHLTDNGVEQTLRAEQLDRQPLAVVVLMQTGGAAPRQFQNYSTFNILLSALLNSTPNPAVTRSAHRVALVTFDSQLQEIWNFPPNVDGLKHAFAHPEGGDHGAAILDALNCGIALLQQQPASFRRILFLLSQPQDNGSQATPEEIVQRLGESNTTVYSISFSSQTAKKLPPPANLAPITIESAAKAMRENTAAEAAALSGGEHTALKQKDYLVRTLSILATDFSNTHMLSFHPASQQSGLHALNTGLTQKSPHRRIVARTLYWVSPVIPGGTEK
jgi:VWFA-related protein